MLTTHDLSFAFEGGKAILRGINLHVGSGEALAICGPSGSGKSTLLALLGSLLLPTSGYVEVQHDTSRPFAWILQSLNCLPARQVLDNVMLGSILHGWSMAERDRRSTEALAKVGLESLRNVKARRLSGGELQRMTVARAIASDRPIILADEPTSHLDQRNAHMVMSALAEVAGDARRAVVIVTHDIQSLPKECRRVRLSDGNLDAF